MKKLSTTYCYAEQISKGKRLNAIYISLNEASEKGEVWEQKTQLSMTPSGTLTSNIQAYSCWKRAAQKMFNYYSKMQIGWKKS